jgi:hypothetical protein
MNLDDKTEDIRASFPIINHVNVMLNARLGIKCVEFILDALHDCRQPDTEQIDNYEKIKNKLLKL